MTIDNPRHPVTKVARASVELDEIIYNESFLEQQDLYSSQFRDVELPKLHKAAITHGYRGPSKHKNNGVVPIRSADTTLMAAFNEFIGELPEGLQDKLEDATPVKVVAHVPSGNRLVGAMYQEDGKHKVYILGAANYRGKLR